MKKLLFCLLILIATIFSACDMLLTTPTDLSGTWTIKSLKANSEEYIDNEHLLAYAPDIATSTIVINSDSTFQLTLVYTASNDATDLLSEIHQGIYTFDGDIIEFNATNCKGLSKEKTCQFRGEVEGNMLYISKSFTAGSLVMLPVVEESVAVMVSFQQD